MLSNTTATAEIIIMNAGGRLYESTADEWAEMQMSRETKPRINNVR